MMQQPAQRGDSSPAEEVHGDRIHVYLRCRPLNGQEKTAHEEQVVDVFTDSNQVTLHGRGGEEAPTKTYSFDGVFGPASTQNDLYERVLEPTVDEVLAGFNCTVFAYGQTGTGKTFTMEGGLEGGAAWSADHAQSGMIPRAVSHIFKKLEHNIDIEYSVRVTHMELYNEELIDLLGNEANKTSKPLKMLEHPRDGVTVHNLEEVTVSSADAIFKILRVSNKRRTTAATNLNAASSRSHCIFTITVHSKETTLDGEEVIRVGKLNLVDLAGSENVARSGVTQNRKREAGVINQSLLTLGRVITSLTQGRPHIPYRESKLTRLLAESLGGRAKTSIIATIGPAACNMEETMSTLEYAHTAKNITNKPQVNNTMTKKALIKDYAAEIERLKIRLLAAREKNGVYVPAEEHATMEAEMNAARERVSELEAQLEMKTSQLDELSTMFTNTRLELKQTAAVLKDTTTELEETARKLGATESTLRDTAETLDNTKAVVQAKAAAEEALYSNASQILNVLEVREVDVEKLHAKIDRKIAVEGTNEQITADFRAYLSDRMEAITGKVATHSEAHEDDLAQLRLQLTDFMRHKTTDIDVMCERFDALQAMVLAQKEQLHALTARQQSDAASALASSGQVASAERARASSALDDYALASARALDEWRTQLTAQLEQVNAWGAAAIAAIERARGAADAWTAKQRGDMQDLAAASGSDAAANAEWTRAHAGSLTSARETLTLASEEGKKALLAQVGSIFGQFVSETNASLEQAAGALVASVDAHTRDVKAHNAVAGASIEQQLVPSVEARRAELADAWTDMADSVSGKVAGDVRRIQADQGTSTVWAERQAALASAADAVHKRVGAAVDREASTTQTNTAAFAKQHAEEVAQLLGAAGEWNEETQGFVFFVAESVGNLRSTVDEDVHEMKKSLDAWGTRMNADVAGIGDRFDNFFYALKDDVSTGATPQRRTVPYPRELPKSRAREAVVEEYWEQLLHQPASPSASSPAVVPAAREAPATPQEYSLARASVSPQSSPGPSNASPYSTPASANSSTAAATGPVTPLADISRAIDMARLSMQLEAEAVAAAPEVEMAAAVAAEPVPAAPVEQRKPEPVAAVVEQPAAAEVVAEEPKRGRKKSMRAPAAAENQAPADEMPRDMTLIRKMTVKDLKSYLVKEGLSEAGLKAALVERVAEHLGLAM